VLPHTVIFVVRTETTHIQQNTYIQISCWWHWSCINLHFDVIRHHGGHFG